MTSLDVHNLLSQDLASKSAASFRYLRKRGLTVRKTIDVMIATYRLEHDIALLHSDRDFLPFSEHLALQVLLKPQLLHILQRNKRGNAGNPMPQNVRIISNRIRAKACKKVASNPF